MKVPEIKFLLVPYVALYFSAGRSENLSSIVRLQILPVIHKQWLTSILQFYSQNTHSKINAWICSLQMSPTLWIYICYKIVHQYWQIYFFLSFSHFVFFLSWFRFWLCLLTYVELRVFIIQSRQGELCNFRYSTHQVVVWVTSLLMPFKSKDGVLCGESYTSVSLVLFSSIFDNIFYFNCLAFEPYHIVTLLPFSAPCRFLVPVFQLKDLFKVNSNFFKTESKVCLMKYLT